MNREVEVFVDLEGETHRVGRLWSRANKGRESASFEYDEAWVRSKLRFPLEPLLTLDAGTHHTAPGKPLFGAVGDSAPDRWGRALMKRAERKAADREGRAPRTLMEIDFLLMVDDAIRQGALRFRDAGTHEFLANNERRIPPLIELPRLLAASERVVEDRDSDEDLRLLLAPGSSLGGARPKAAVLDTDGSLSIAKFPHSGDEYNVESWSGVALSLAARAGVEVPAHRVADVAGRQVLIVRRFDRVGEHRVPFLSAMSMIGASDGEDHSYLEIVDALRRYGAEVARDLPQLWRRIAFGVLVSNVDDHLRNHGFLYDPAKGGWRLSPAYDINPVPIDVRPRVLSMMIDDRDNSASFDLVLEVGDYFGLRTDDMKVIAGEVASAVSGWREEAGRLGISNTEVARMASAFEHDDLRKAREYGGS
ncbi:MAG TPA: type II toxin-antitoxin system HipA family toxin [Pyrinomonadaceae bacterium]|jgi:serine/threonine-protein kinase HipA